MMATVPNILKHAATIIAQFPLLELSEEALLACIKPEHFTLSNFSNF